MKKGHKILLFSGGLIVLLALISIPAHKWSRKHVNYMTAVEDHPLKCYSCHLYNTSNRFVQKLVNRQYYSPFNLVVSKDGKYLYVVAQEAGMLLKVDVAKDKVVNKIKVGLQPHSVVLDEANNRAFVSNQWSDNISVIDLNENRVVSEIHTANGPAGLAVSIGGENLYVVNSFSSTVSVFNLKTGNELNRVASGNNPTGIQLSPDGKFLYVTSRRALIAPYGSPVETELTRFSTESQRVTEHKSMESAYMMENAAFTPSGDLAMVALIRPKNLLPTLQVDKGWMMTEGIGIIEQKTGGKTVQLLLDEPEEYYSDPFDIVITPDGKRAFVSHSGADCISVINIDSVRHIINEIKPYQVETYADDLGMSDRFVIQRIHTGANPKGMALSPDGKTLYVAEHLADRISMFNTMTLQPAGIIDLGRPGKMTVLRQGRRLFNNAGHTFENQYSCYTCHPDEHEDGLVYNMASKDMGRNITNTMSLRDVGDTPPYKWTGKNQSVYKQDGMRFSTVLTRTEAFSYDELDAIAAYIMRGIPSPPNLQYNPGGKLTDAQLRGKAIFDRAVDFNGIKIPESNRCITCHPAPYFTNKAMAYVGTLAATDDSMLFDTPGLFNLYTSAPYLHDGRAATLEEIWTLYGQSEKHGVINDLSKMQLNDLIEYLKSLRDPLYEKEASIENKKETTEN